MSTLSLRMDMKPLNKLSTEIWVMSKAEIGSAHAPKTLHSVKKKRKLYVDVLLKHMIIV